MVFVHEYCMELMKNDQQCWKDLMNMPLDGEKQAQTIEQSTKQKMLAEYEVKTGKNGGKRQLSRIPLWYFLHEILEVDKCKQLISWDDPENLVFTIKKPNELATLWGMVKNKETMTYAKLARGIRYYYGKGVIEKYRGKRFSYKFVLSKKTKAVLLKNKNHIKVEPMEEDINRTESPRKRKSSGNTLKVLPKRRRSSESLDSNDSQDVPSDCSSVEDDNEFIMRSEWNELDVCLADIFSDSRRMREIFSDDTFKMTNTDFPRPHGPKFPNRTEMKVEENYDIFDLLDDLDDCPDNSNFDTINEEKKTNENISHRFRTYSENVNGNCTAESSRNFARQKSKSESEIQTALPELFLSVSNEDTKPVLDFSLLERVLYTDFEQSTRLNEMDIHVEDLNEIMFTG